MTDPYRERIPRDLGHIAELLESRRPAAGPLELDRVKLRAKQQSKAPRRRPVLRPGKGDGFMRSRVVSMLLVTGLLGGGTGALAATGSGPFDVHSSDEGASHSQYCPPTSQQPGKPKHPGPARCGKEPPGHDDQGDGNGNGNGNGNGHGDERGHGNAYGNGHGNGGRGNGGGKGKE